MGRIRKAYEARYRQLLKTAGARRVEKGEQYLASKAAEARACGLCEDDAVRAACNRIAAHPFYRDPAGQNCCVTFYCDAGLGGLARWLRAAGYVAHWKAGITDADLLAAAEQTGSVILTTDSILMERKVLRDGLKPGLWLPPTLRVPEQLAQVFREFHLQLRDSRCMNCGGQLRRESKEALGQRIPPRTYRWLEEFFVCESCGKLYWHGTHWSHIRSTLEAVAKGSKD